MSQPLCGQMATPPAAAFGVARVQSSPVVASPGYPAQAQLPAYQRAGTQTRLGWLPPYSQTWHKQVGRLLAAGCLHVALLLSLPTFAASSAPPASGPGSSPAASPPGSRQAEPASLEPVLQQAPAQAQPGRIAAAISEQGVLQNALSLQPFVSHAGVPQSFPGCGIRERGGLRAGRVAEILQSCPAGIGRAAA